MCSGSVRALFGLCSGPLFVALFGTLLWTDEPVQRYNGVCNEQRLCYDDEQWWPAAVTTIMTFPTHTTAISVVATTITTIATIPTTLLLFLRWQLLLPLLILLPLLLPLFLL